VCFVIPQTIAKSDVNNFTSNNDVVCRAYFCDFMSGYRHVSLRNECNQPQGLATLFVHIRVTDYIPDAFAGTCSAWRSSMSSLYAVVLREIYVISTNTYNIN